MKKASKKTNNRRRTSKPTQKPTAAATAAGTFATAKEETRESVWAEAVGDVPNSASYSLAPAEDEVKSCPHKEKPKIIAYTLGFAPTISRPGPAQRDFMESTPNRFAYRCLPLNIANQYGWELLSPCTFEAIWNGDAHGDAIDINIIDDGWPPPVSHFGSGVLTFHINQIFRTPPGVQMMVTGPMNNPKDGISAMTGIIETDWSHYTFTMNWAMTRPYFPVRFEKGEPFAHIMPVNLAQIEQYETVFLPIDSNPDLKEAYEGFQASRNQFNDALNDPTSIEATKEKWQKGYFRGKGPDGCPVKGHSHWTKLDVMAFPGSAAKKK
ncbi:MAG: hypothetical protein FD163_452 [Hyphomonadaceae bacterium]|nr:MAG: hypothetical protein FD128_442 [Hyphomonadaceae bacterium]KAF0187177.1 MAG: hypothetical protein FD163_452 [Hyphomonadaceae bacterium]